MSQRRSPSSSSGDDDPTPARGARTFEDRTGPDASESGNADWDDEWDDWAEPNFLVRRALVVGAVVLAIAVIVVVVTFLIGDDDNGNSASSAAAEWDTTVVLTDAEIRLLDPNSGDEIDTFASTVDLLDAQSIVVGDVLVTVTDEGAIGLVDLNDGTTRRGRSGIDETLLASSDNPQIAFVGPDAGGDVTIVDTTTRNVFSVADVAGLDSPLIFVADVRVNASASHIAVPVPNAFQSFVIDVAEETSEAFAGRVIAISDTMVVTEQPAGAEAEIEFHELIGERLGSVDVPTPVASMLTADGSLLSVAADGSVQLVKSDGTVDDVDPVIDADGDQLGVTGGFPAADGTRLVLDAGGTTVVLDDSGAVLASAVGQITATPPVATRCVIVGSGSTTDPSTVLELQDGSVVTTIERGIPAATSVDGCTVALLGATDNVLTNGEVIAVDANSIAQVSPDGAAVVVQDGRDTELVRLGDDDTPTEIADEPVVVRFGRRN